MARKRRVKKLEEMSTPELAKEAARLIKTCKRQMAETEQQVFKLAAMLGVHIRLVNGKPRRVS
jgi:hypothetical protein